MTSDRARPPYSREIIAALDAMGEMVPPSMTADMIPAARAQAAFETEETVLAGTALSHRKLSIEGYAGQQVPLSVISPRASAEASAGAAAGGRPAVFFIHGGGMVMGDRWTGISTVLPLVDLHDAVVIAAEYHLAPEHPDPHPVEDCYAAYTWTIDHAAELGVDPDRVLLAGGSAGGGIAAGLALLLRDRGGPAPLGQLLVYPMLDDRMQTTSSQQFHGVGIFDRDSAITGWTALLGDRRGTDAVSHYAAPARATDLSGLPPAFLEVASAEVFRDEVVAYASGIWASGGIAELHVWPGGTHGYDVLAPTSSNARGARTTRAEWVTDLLAAPPAPSTPDPDAAR